MYLDFNTLKSKVSLDRVTPYSNSGSFSILSFLLSPCWTGRITGLQTVLLRYKVPTEVYFPAGTSRNSHEKGIPGQAIVSGRPCGGKKPLLIYLLLKKCNGIGQQSIFRI